MHACILFYTYVPTHTNNIHTDTDTHTRTCYTSVTILCVPPVVNVCMYRFMSAREDHESKVGSQLIKWRSPPTHCISSQVPALHTGLTVSW